MVAQLEYVLKTLNAANERLPYSNVLDLKVPQMQGRPTPLPMIYPSLRVFKLTSKDYFVCGKSPIKSAAVVRW